MRLARKFREAAQRRYDDSIIVRNAACISRISALQRKEHFRNTVAALRYLPGWPTFRRNLRGCDACALHM